MLQTAHIREELFSRFPSISKAAPGFHPALSFFQWEKCLVLPTKLHFVKRIKPIVYDKSLTIFLHILRFSSNPPCSPKKRPGYPHFPPSFPHLRGKPCYTCRNQNQIFPANFGAFPCLFAFFIKSRPAFSVLFSGIEKSFSREEFFSPKFSTPGRFSTPGTAGALFHTFVKNRLWKSPFSHREQRSKIIRFCVISPQKTALLWGAVPGQRRAAVAMQSQRDAAGGKRPVCPPANAKDPLSFAHFYIILWKISIAIWK